MDRKSFEKLKTTTIIIVVIQAILDTAEYLIDPPFKAGGTNGTSHTALSIILLLVGSALLGAIWVYVIIRENPCLVELFMIFQIIAVFYRVTVTLLQIYTAAELKIAYLVMHVFVALFSLITAGYLVVYYRKLRLVRSQPNDPNQPLQTV